MDSNTNVNQIGIPKISKSYQILGFVSNNAGLKKRSSSQPRGSAISRRTSPLQQPGEDLARRSLWASKSVSVDCRGKENSESMANTDANAEMETKIKEVGGEDVVSGFLYDRLQKEVINLRKACHEKEDGLDAKDEQIKTLVKKVEALNKAIEVEARKVRKETPSSPKAIISAPKDENKKPWSKNLLKRVTKSS